MSSIVTEQAQTENYKAVSANLPRLLYIGDVAVEATVAGSTLLYRLLQDYPPERLLIAEGNLWNSHSEKRLPRVRYESFNVGAVRLLRTRLHPYYSSFLHLTAISRSKRLKHIIDEFRPEAILTVTHGYSWLTASSLAEKFALPLHLVLHDDWVSIQEGILPANVLRKLKQQFGKTYRSATSRLCISPYMVEEFATKYSANGAILYPSRAADAPQYHDVPQRPQHERKLTFAFAGTVNTRGYAESLSILAAILEEIGGALVIYSNLSADDISRCRLMNRNITVRPILPFRELLESLREETDVLFVPMSFAVEDAQNMKVSFPSKLADYTITGLPLLIWGPPYCSAVSWARDNAGVAEVVETPHAETLKHSVMKLMADESYRRRLGENALSRGREFFAHETAIRNFYQAVRPE